MAEGLFWFGAWAIAGIWLWLAALAWFVLTLVYIEKEKGFGAFFVLICFLAFMHLGGAVNLLDFVKQSPLLLIGEVTGFFLVGIIWSMIKFKFYIRKIRIDTNDRLIPSWRASFLKDHRIQGETIPAEKMSEFKTYVDEKLDSSYGRSMEVLQNKERILLWSVWWPFSMLWTALRDWITDIFDYLINDVFGKIYEKISASERSKIKYQ